MEDTADRRLCSSNSNIRNKIMKNSQGGVLSDRSKLISFCIHITNRMKPKIGHIYQFRRGRIGHIYYLRCVDEYGRKGQAEAKS
jgi:hypothetical protein